jgi:hypothetical protein
LGLLHEEDRVGVPDRRLKSLFEAFSDDQALVKTPAFVFPVVLTARVVVKGFHSNEGMSSWLVLISTFVEGTGQQCNRVDWERKTMRSSPW